MRIDENFICPGCGSTDDMRVQLMTWGKLSQKGDDFETDSDDYGHEWDDDYAMICDACNHTGVVRDFYSGNVLFSTINNQEIGEEIKVRFDDFIGLRQGAERAVFVLYERGQWWAQEQVTGAQFSVIDTDEGYDFEQVTEGEE